MGRRLKAGRELLDAMEALSGGEAIMDEICEWVANGGTPKQLAEEKFEICVSALWQWMRAGKGRVTAYRNALKVQADNLAHESIEAVNSATVENVSVRKLQAEHKLKMAGKWDGENYDSNAASRGTSSTGITVIVQRGAVLALDYDPDGPQILDNELPVLEHASI